MHRIYLQLHARDEMSDIVLQMPQSPLNEPRTPMPLGSTCSWNTAVVLTDQIWRTNGLDLSEDELVFNRHVAQKRLATLTSKQMKNQYMYKVTNIAMNNPEFYNQIQLLTETFLIENNSTNALTVQQALLRVRNAEGEEEVITTNMGNLNNQPVHAAENATCHKRKRSAGEQPKASSAKKAKPTTKAKKNAKTTGTSTVKGRWQ